MAKEKQNLTEALKKYFGFDKFKGDQEAIVQNVLDGKNTFVLMPTGGGKSLCYQLPSLLMEGTAIVISPLIALMKNQVDVISSMSDEVTVTGRPAYYQNFRTLPDSVWQKPGFYGQPEVVYVGTHDGKKIPTLPNPNYGAPKRGGIAGLASKLSGKNKSQNQVKTEREDTGWRRSGMSAQLDFMGGYMHMAYSSGPHVFSKEECDNAFAGALLTVGVNLTSHWFVGVGSGFYWDFDVDNGNIPIFGDIRFNFSGKKRSTWFMDYKAGAAVITNKSGFRGELFMAPCFGYDFGGYEVGVQLMYHQFRYKDKVDYQIITYSEPKWDMFHVGLRLGISL